MCRDLTEDEYEEIEEFIEECDDVDELIEVREWLTSDDDDNDGGRSKTYKK